MILLALLLFILFLWDAADVTLIALSRCSTRIGLGVAVFFVVHDDLVEVLEVFVGDDEGTEDDEEEDDDEGGAFVVMDDMILAS